MHMLESAFYMYRMFRSSVRVPAPGNPTLTRRLSSVRGCMVAAAVGVMRVSIACQGTSVAKMLAACQGIVRQGSRSVGRDRFMGTSCQGFSRVDQGSMVNLRVTGVPNMSSLGARQCGSVTMRCGSVIVVLRIVRETTGGSMRMR